MSERETLEQAREALSVWTAAQTRSMRWTVSQENSFYKLSSALVLAAKREQREADANLSESFVIEERGTLDTMRIWTTDTARRIAAAIRAGGSDAESR